MEKAQPYATNLSQADRRALRGDRGESILLVDELHGPASNVDLHLNILEPDSGPGPAHYHKRAENIHLVLSGCIDVEIAGETRHLEREDVLFIPPGVVHRTSNPGEEIARFIEIYAPAGEDFQVVGEEEQS